MTRLIGGRAGGRRLLIPAGRETRPTTDRVREALFSRLEHDGWIQDLAVLDLFAGSGALGLEAASRGAATVTLVEQQAPAARAIARNAEELGLHSGCQLAVVTDKVQKFLTRAPQQYDLVIADPPYPLDEEELAEVLRTLATGWLTAQALVVVERSRRSPEPRWSGRLQGIDQRRYGEAQLWFAQYDAVVDGPVLAC